MPSLVPKPQHDADSHFVLCDFGTLCRVVIETDPEAADRGTLVRNIIAGQHRRPLKIIALDAGGRRRDVFVTIARDVVTAATRAGESQPDDTGQFLAALTVRDVS
jgi:hypothetical protein